MRQIFIGGRDLSIVVNSAAIITIVNGNDPTKPGVEVTIDQIDELVEELANLTTLKKAFITEFHNPDH